MSLFRREYYDLIVDKAQWSIARRPRAATGSFAYTHCASGDFFSKDEQASFSEVCANLTQKAKVTLEVTLASALSKGFSFVPPRGTRSLAELRAVARARFEQLFGESPQDWMLEGQWHARHPIPVCGLPSGAIDTVYAATRRHRIELRSLSASWPRGLHLALRKPAGFVCIAESSSTTFLLHDNHGRIHDARIHLANEEPNREQCMLLLERQMRISGSDSAVSVVWKGNADWLDAIAKDVDGMNGVAGRTPVVRSPAWWAA